MLSPASRQAHQFQKDRPLNGTHAQEPSSGSDEPCDLLPDLGVLNGYAADWVEGFVTNPADTGFVVAGTDGVADNAGETVFWSIGAVN